MNDKEGLLVFYIRAGIKERLSKNYDNSIKLLNIGLDTVNYSDLLDDQIIIKGLFSRGVSFYQLQKIDLAGNDFSQILEINPNYAPALFGKAISLYKLKQYNNAIPSFELFIQQSDDNNSQALISAYYKLMICYEKIENYSGAKKIADKILESQPNLIKPLECHCRYYFQEKQWDKLGLTIEKLQKINGNLDQSDSIISICKCIIAHQNGNLKELEDCYLEYIDSFSSRVYENFEDWERLGIIHNNYGCILADIGEWVRAFDQFSLASDNYEFNLECEKNMCIALINLEDYNKASNYIQELVDGNGRDDAESWYIRALVQIKLNHIPEACESLKVASDKGNSSDYILEAYWRILEIYQRKLEWNMTGNISNSDNIDIFSEFFNEFKIPKINPIEIEL